MVATRCPKFIRATARCMAMVDFPVPPFSLPTTMTCAEVERRALACTNMTRKPLLTAPYPSQSLAARYELNCCHARSCGNPRSARCGQLRRPLAQGADAMNERGLVVAAFDDCRERALPVVAVMSRRRLCLGFRLRGRGLAGNQRLDR